MLVLLCTLAGLTLLLVALLPLLKYRAWMADGVAITDPVLLRSLQSEIVSQIKRDEEAQKKNLISATELEKRRAYLAGRYIDYARRLDSLAGAS